MIGTSPAAAWRRPATLAALVGAALVMAGAALPWLTLFAGLQRMAGLSGRNGQLLFAGGALVAALALLATWRPHAALRHATLAAGAALAGFSAWIAVGLVQLVAREAANPMLLPRLGPGVFVAAAGALLVVGAAGAGRIRRGNPGRGA
jgi:hypothetical protein